MKSEREILKKLTLREKIGLLEGVDSWKTREIPRLGVRALYLTDGPLGVRKKATYTGRGAVGLGRAKPATLFPAPATLAASFDPALSERVGRAMGREARAYGVDVLLAPAMNVKRDPRCGRNFEYY
ncbi:MAG: glycoside hydrolase family 3 protein, partial [Clostridia bacterium]|nr:glycoside hydrolase family 3 protein [Clostridia bacterium]